MEILRCGSLNKIFKGCLKACCFWVNTILEYVSHKMSLMVSLNICFIIFTCDKLLVSRICKVCLFFEEGVNKLNTLYIKLKIYFLNLFFPSKYF